VIRDASGREVETKQAFYNAPSLLKPGLYEYSAEAGYARYNYGVASNDYGTSPIGTVSLRAGITDWLTLEAHSEGGLGLANGGVGAVVNVGDRAVVSTAISGSRRSDGSTGVQLYGGFDTQVGIVAIHGSTTRALDKYEDLAVATARLRPTTAYEAERDARNTASTRYANDYRPFTSRDTLTVALPIAFDHSTISATYVRSEYTDRPTDQIVSVSYSRPLIAGATLFATAYTRMDDVKNTGFYLSASMPLGDMTTGASVSKSAQGLSVSADASKPLGTEPGSWGWRVRDAEGANANRQGAIAYRNTAARMEASIQQDETSVRQTAEVSGSIVSMGGNVHFANTIDDGFAVVNAGAPGIRVLSENRFVGETDESGHLLVPGLRSNQLNNIAIDPTNLSVSAEVDQPSKQVVPAFKSGVYVDFKVKREGSSAIVIFKQPTGAFIDVGSRGTIDGSEEPFVVGYEGQAFIRNLQNANTVTIASGQGGCHASFSFVPKPDTQVVVGPVVCQ
jgi:outer membrane usher protein